MPYSKNSSHSCPLHSLSLSLVLTTLKLFFARFFSFSSLIAWNLEAGKENFGVAVGGDGRDIKTTELDIDEPLAIEEGGYSEGKRRM